MTSQSRRRKSCLTALDYLSDAKGCHSYLFAPSRYIYSSGCAVAVADCACGTGIGTILGDFSKAWEAAMKAEGGKAFVCPRSIRDLSLCW